MDTDTTVSGDPGTGPHRPDGTPTDLRSSDAARSWDSSDTRHAPADLALQTDAGRQLARGFGTHGVPFEWLRDAARARLADSHPVDPNHPQTWTDPDRRAQAILRRHGVTQLNTARLELRALRALVAAQAGADRAAGLDWTSVTVPASRLDDALRQAPGCRSTSTTPRSESPAATADWRSRAGSGYESSPSRPTLPAPPTRLRTVRRAPRHPQRGDGARRSRAAMIVAEGRLLAQWREELLAGAPARGLPPLAPNIEPLVLAEHGPLAGRLRSFDRELGERPGVVLVANGVLDRHPGELAALSWHVLIADEALRYANPATEAHQALKQLRLGAVADCWLLTATPRGKDAEQLDVLVGVALGDEAMIRERLNTREAGDLLDELNARRLRVNYGPHLVRVTRQDMQAWMPVGRPAQPLALEADAALAELLEAIRRGGRDAYRQLVELLRELRELEPGRPVYQRALAEIARVQGVVLGNVGVYIDASIDPETLTHSKAALAQALCRQGLVADAMRGGGDGLPLLRGVTAQTLAGIAGEEQVPTATAPACSRSSCKAWPTTPAYRSRSATSRPAPASGTGSSTACSPTSARTGAAGR